MKKIITTSCILTFLLVYGQVGTAMAASFSDVPASNPDYVPMESLKSIGVFEGYPDGTFQPDQQINRAEALKIILKVSAKPEVTGDIHTSFSDVPVNAWFAGYVMEAKGMSIISGNPNGTFEPDRTINKAEFLKMLLTAFNENVTSVDVGSSQEPIAADVSADNWFAPYFAHAKNVGIIYPDLQNQLEPDHLLTRAECAEIIYKIYILKNGSDIGKLLSIAQTNLSDVPVEINGNNLSAALKDADEAVFYSGLALGQHTNSDIITGTSDISLGFQQLVMAHQAKSRQNVELARSLVNEAENFAKQAAASDSSLQALSDQINQLGNNLLKQ